MGSGQSTSAAKTPLVDVRKFVMDNINEAFNALRGHDNRYMGSNCYALLHTLTQGSITSDRLQATGLSVLPVVFEGTTQMVDKFPEIYYRMFQVILNQTRPDEDTSDKIHYLFQKKQEWIRNPSDVVNDIVRVTGGARYIIAQSTDTQNNALSNACAQIESSAKSAGGADVKCSMSKIFTGADEEEKNRCCICGLGELPTLTDIEHVVSSQLLILLGICPAPKSWAAFWQLFNEFNSNGEDPANWVEKVINFFPSSEERDDARKVFRSMMLPAHSFCNRNIKREFSPLGINLETGTITGYIDQPFVNMYDNTYIQQVIVPSITYTNDNRTRKLSKKDLSEYTYLWIDNQRKVFANIAGFLNSIDQRNNDASLGLIQFLYVRALESDESDKNAFVEFVSDLLGFEKDRIKWDHQLYNIIYEDSKTKLIIMTKLTLVVEAVLVLFQSDVQDPIQEVKYGDISTDSSYAPTDFSREGSQEGYMTTETSLDSEGNVVSLLSPGFSQEGKPAASSDNVKNKKSIFSYLPSRVAQWIDNTGIDADIDDDMNASQDSAGSTFSNELGDNPGQEKKDIKNSTRDERIDALNEKRAKKVNHALNTLIEEIADEALARYLETPDEDNKLPTLSNMGRTRLILVAKIAARDVLNKRGTEEAAFINALDALNNNNDSHDNEYENELDGGSRKRKYTTTRRRSTRKRRPSKKPRRTIRRQRRNNKRTQKSRK
jgi:hypothetical protein